MKWFSHALRGYPHWPKTACVPKEWRWNLTPAWQETNQKKACNFHSTDVWDQTVYFLSVTSGVDFTLTRSSCSMLGLQNSFRVDIIHVCARVCVHHFLIVPERFLLIMKVDHVPKWTLFSSIYLNFGNELFQDLLLTSYIYIYTYVCMCVRARGRVGVYIYMCVCVCVWNVRFQGFCNRSFPLLWSSKLIYKDFGSFGRYHSQTGHINQALFGFQAYEMEMTQTPLLFTKTNGMNSTAIKMRKTGIKMLYS